MQDKYVGDIGDFGKYALLNHLRCRSKLGLSVVWYRVNPDHTDREHQKNDGKHISYLGLFGKKPDSRLLELDLGLFCQLQQIVGDVRTRNIESIENSHLLGETTKFHSESLSNAVLTGRRKNWLQSALQKVQADDILFLDPDNGLASEAKNGDSILDAKHVLRRDELGKFWQNGHPIIVLYHHLNRSCSHDSQIKTLNKEIQDLLESSVVLPLRYRRGSSRAYFVIARKTLSKNSKLWLRDFVKPWPGNSFECKFSD